MHFNNLFLPQTEIIKDTTNTSEEVKVTCLKLKYLHLKISDICQDRKLSLKIQKLVYYLSEAAAGRDIIWDQITDITST